MGFILSRGTLCRTETICAVYLKVLNIDLPGCSSENLRRRDAGTDGSASARDGHISLHSQQQCAADGQQALFRRCSLQVSRRDVDVNQPLPRRRPGEYISRPERPNIIPTTLYSHAIVEQYMQVPLITHFNKTDHESFNFSNEK